MHIRLALKASISTSEVQPPTQLVGWSIYLLIQMLLKTKQ